MSKTEKPAFPLRLTQAQRRDVAGLLPHFEPRLLLETSNQRTLQFSLDEMKEIAQACRVAVSKAPTGMQRNSLRHVVDTAERGVEKFGKGKVLARHWMMTVGDMDDDDDARNKVFASVGATDDALGLYDE